MIKLRTLMQQTRSRFSAPLMTVWYTQRPPVHGAQQLIERRPFGFQNILFDRSENVEVKAFYHPHAFTPDIDDKVLKKVSKLELLQHRHLGY